MRTAMLVLVLVSVLFVPSSWADIVIHDGISEIVSFEGGMCLASNGQVWSLTNGGPGGWQRSGWEIYDVPIPVESIRFWCHNSFISMTGEAWIYYGGGWVNFGSWPASAVPDDMTAVAVPSSKTMPNPSPGPCQIAFRVQAEGPIAVDIFDTTGRIVRRLLDGSHPAGDYSLKWDGRDDNGRELPTGVYFARVATGRGSAVGRAVIAR